jgi:hypothetical protein
MLIARGGTVVLEFFIAGLVSFIVTIRSSCIIGLTVSSLTQIILSAFVTFLLSLYSLY